MSDRTQARTRVYCELSAEGKRLVTQFEESWANKTRPSIDACLPANGEERRAILEQLVHIDLDNRLRIGDPARVEEYLERYPELEREESTVLALIWTEYESRQSSGPTASEGEYVRRFPRYRGQLPWQADRPPAPETTEAWKVGDVILDVYEVKKLSEQSHFAKGGMGLVYRVHHRGWDLDLAVKCPQPRKLVREQAKRDFERECEAWIKLGLHPNIVTCYYVRRVAGIPRIFAEFVEGGTLEQWIDDKRLYAGGAQRALARILDIAIQVAWGLHDSHQQRVIHLDVKPGNVLMHGDVAKVCDFGLARFQLGAPPTTTDSTQGTMAVLGGGMTPAYCSPEQFEGAIQADAGLPVEQIRKLTRRTDIWSWGVMVLAMFYGRSACRHGGHTARAVLEAYLKREHRDETLPRMPEALADLLKRCFRRNPALRPKTMQEVAAELIEIYEEVTFILYPRQEPATADLQAESMNNRAVSLLDLEKVEDAAQLLEDAWQRQRWQPQVTHNRGLLAWRRGQITDTELVAQLRELCTTRPQDWMAAYSLGMVQLERGEVERAVESLTHAAEFGGDCEMRAVLDRARALLRQAPHCVRAFTSRPDYLTVVWLSADRRWAISQVDEHTLRLWNTISGRTSVTLATPTGAHRPSSLSADGRWQLSVADAQTLRLLDVSAQRQVQTFRPVAWGDTAVARSSDGRWSLAEGPAHVLELRETSSGKLLRALRGHAGRVTGVSLSADDRWALSGSMDNSLRLWDTATGCCVRTFAINAPASAVFLSPDGCWALSASEGKTLRLWNLEILSGVTRRFTAPMLLCHITSSEEAEQTQTRFHQLCDSAAEALAADRCAEALGLIRAARDLRGYEMDFQALELWAQVGRRSVRKHLRNAWSIQTLEGHAAGVYSVVASPDRRWVLSASEDKTLRLWQTETGQCVRTLEGHTDWVRSACLSADSRLALSASWDRTLRLWDLAAERSLRTFEGHTKYVNGAQLSADGRLAVSASRDRTLRLWETATGRTLRTYEGHDDGVSAVCASRDGHWLVSAGEDKTVRLWDVAASRAQRVFEGHTDWVNAVAISPDGRWAISGSKDWTLRLWELASGRCLRVFKGHTGSVTSVALSAGGQWVLSGSKDKSVRLWEVATGECVHTLSGHAGPVNAVSFTADGRWALSGGEDNVVRVWELDWDYEFPGWADWNEAARGHLEMFLALRRPYASDGITRTGQPVWTEDDLQRLLVELQHRGFGWLRPEGVRKELLKMTAEPFAGRPAS